MLAYRCWYETTNNTDNKQIVSNLLLYIIYRRFLVKVKESSSKIATTTRRQRMLHMEKTFRTRNSKGAYLEILGNLFSKSDADLLRKTVN